MICPRCQSRATGRVGQNVYFCWDCAVEFVPTKKGFKVYRLEEDGTLVLDSVDGKTVPLSTVATEATPTVSDPIEGRIQEPGV